MSSASSVLEPRLAVEDRVVDEPQIDTLGSLVKQSPSLAKEDWHDADGELIDQIRLNERGHEAPTAEEEAMPSSVALPLNSGEHVVGELNPGGRGGREG